MERPSRDHEWKVTNSWFVRQKNIAFRPSERTDEALVSDDLSMECDDCGDFMKHGKCTVVGVLGTHKLDGTGEVIMN